jgi:ABC-type transport system substrate-binding protein
MKFNMRDRKAVSTSVAAVIVIVIIAVAGIGAYLYLTSGQGTNTTTTSSTNTGSTSSSTATGTSSSSTGTTSTASKFRDTLIIDDANWPTDDLNQLWAVFSLPWPNWLMGSVYQPLVTVNQTAQFQANKIQYLPGLANWTISPDSTTYTFNIRHGVKFSNGDPLNAYQVWAEMYAFYYISGNASSWLSSYNIFDMSSVKFGPTTLTMLNASGLANPSSTALKTMTDSSWPVYTTSPYQIVFRLKAPFQWFPGLLVAYQGLVFDAQWALRKGIGVAFTPNIYFNQHPIPGTGPYTVTQISENAFVQFKQDTNYWGNNLSAAEIAKTPIFDPGHAKTVVVNYKPDDTARYADLSTGTSQISLIETNNWNLVQANLNKYAYQTIPSWGGQVIAVSLNAQRYPTNITAVRDAIVHAINYTDINRKVFFGTIVPFVGPGYPAWKDFYDLGNLPPYTYNLTLAQQYLKGYNVTKFPTLTFTVIAGCAFCVNVAQVVLADLAQIGLNVNIVVQPTATYYAPYGAYTTEVGNAAQIGHLSILGAEDWGPTTLTPADAWVSFVVNESSYGNWAVYSNPLALSCAHALTGSSDTSFIRSQCTPAQAQIYNDAPYAWLGVSGLWYASSGSVVWQKGVITGFLVDPVWSGQSDILLFNTVTFG